MQLKIKTKNKMRCLVDSDGDDMVPLRSAVLATNTTRLQRLEQFSAAVKVKQLPSKSITATAGRQHTICADGVLVAVPLSPLGLVGPVRNTKV